MSLHQLAKHVRDHGRGDDTQLMHVTPNEIKGLQALALRNGTSLTTNPYTGLPEAGVLDKLLPTVIGAAGAYFGVSPAMTGLITGGVNYAMTGNLQKGLMSGLGAWGGASLMSNVMGAGAGVMGADLMGTASQAGTDAMLETGYNPTHTMSPQEISEGVASKRLTPQDAEAYGKAFSQSFDPAREATGIDQMTKGFGAIKQDPGSFFKENMFPIAATAAPFLMKDDSSNTGGTTPVSQGTSYIRPYTYSQVKNPNYGQPGQPYFIQSQTAQEPVVASQWGNKIYPSYADGGITSLDGGMRQGGMFPQSQQEPLEFATPTQRPISAEVVSADYDPKVQPYTGEAVRMADGGISGVTPLQLAAPTNKYNLPPQVPSQSVTNYNALLADRANNEYNVQPAPLNMLPGGGQQAGAEDLGKIINQYYVKNLGRQADQPGLEAWTQQVQQGSSLADINKGIAASPEGVTYKAYTDLLGRRPDEGGMAFWQKYINEGHTPEEIRDAFMQSPEYLAKHPNTVAPVAGPAQADIDAYNAANPTTAKVYDPKTQTYSTPSVTQAQIDAWKATKASSDPMNTDPSGFYIDGQGQVWASKAAYDNAHREADGGAIHAYAAGGPTYGLGSYSDGGRLLKGPGDGVSDNIPAMIGEHQPARLADGEFVVPARIVSEIGNGSTDAGARKLYEMMDRVQSKRAKSAKKGKFAINSKADKELPV